MQSDERQINCIDRCCSSNYYDHLGLVRKPTTPSLEAFWDLWQNFLLVFFLFLVGIVMDLALNTHGRKRLRKFPQKLFMEFVSTLGAVEFSWSNFHAIQDTSLNVVDRIYINVKDLPFQSLGSF